MSRKPDKGKNAPKPEGAGGLVPRLRFPEFREAGEWEIKSLKSVCFMQAGKFVPASDIFEPDKQGVYPCYGGNGLRGYTKTYTHSGRYPLIGRQGALCGNVNLVNGQFHATEHAVVVTPQEGINVEWLFYTLDLLNLNRFATGQAQPGLSVEVLEKVSGAVPKEEKEQQKIANCLSSLDDQIRLETERLNALKDHKKGLMQQMFPAEGETVPRLRFAEFREAGEWRVICLRDACRKIAQGGTPDTSISKYWNGSIEWLTPAEMGKTESRFVRATKRKISEIGLQSCSSELLPAHSVIISIRAPIGYLAINTVEMAINQGCKGLIPSDSTNADFLYYWLLYHKESLIDLGSGNTFKELSGESLKQFRALFPDVAEQQKIADCLSSLDDRIRLETERLNALKDHKKGLMQQLFPVLRDIAI